MSKKGPTKGSGGKGRSSLEGRGPTPKAEDRPYHKAYRSKQLAERSAAKRSTAKRTDRIKVNAEFVTGRNSVVEALRAGIPVKALHVAIRIEVDDRVRESLKLAAAQGIPLMEASKPELDRMTDGAIHQGMALQIPAYEYKDAVQLATKTIKDYDRGYTTSQPLLLALDGITDPRNLGAIVRSASAFGADGVIIPERRSVGMTASAWKTSAGAAVRVPVAKCTNLTSALKEIKAAGIFVIGLDAGGDMDLPNFELATGPLCIVVGSEGKGLSRLVRENCDAIVSIPIDSAMESLNASMAVGISLYEVSRLRKAQAK
ncbi:MULTISPECIES: 23S rRNA (guanosine(2251)-2'-O)-methyltransferase RlmB [Micrococcaceae]|uniref:23S rRNA (guanosine(2251)-2'-O)-methyltransferase RlmB n=1 Tax=Micrococcaceae TaxID=1268 RepID=UPI0010359CF4|nr:MULTISPECIES: 23S rRNA (guanosine(2251)-2'-O)-methyltransferase RlmB [Micrococcaceae]TAP24984.1 23S rRNA (guanosine(2251)-2'-O)-methyltransferase RlmB [Arthrobacter sp. S41]UXN31968.1 23S rRNA (guanosine(2251)-2'-O)-methyltransferase RlmB [Glutamicibacter sp. M10]